MKHDIREWIIVNIDHLKNLIEPLKKRKLSEFSCNDVVFHEDIEKEYRSLARAIICIEISKSLACSTESIYDSIEDTEWEELWTKIF